MSAEYPVGTVAQVRVGEWEGRALRLSTGIWALASTIGGRELFADNMVTVLAVELPAPVAEPKAFGARVQARGRLSPYVETFLRVHETPDGWWMSSADGLCYRWSDLINPVVLHNPEADR